MLNLRGHHLICLHFFRGEGYSDQFIISLSRILQKAEAGEQIEAASGADDVCNICPYLKGGKCFHDQEAEQEIQKMDAKALELLGLTGADIVQWLDIRGKIPVLFTGWYEEFCSACNWRHACDKNAFFRQLAHEKTVRGF
jgi:hypothetical protein